MERLTRKRQQSAIGYLEDQLAEDNQRFHEYQRVFYNDCPPQTTMAVETNQTIVAESLDHPPPTTVATDDPGVTNNRDHEQCLELDPAATRLWRKLCLVTHPDKNAGDPDLTEAFQRVRAAHLAGDTQQLLAEAVRLGVPLPPELEPLWEPETHIRLLREQLERLHRSLAWVWCQPETDETTRQRLVATYGLRRSD